MITVIGAVDARYFGAPNPMGSVKVAGTGTTISVLQNNRAGQMTVQVD